MKVKNFIKVSLITVLFVMMSVASVYAGSEDYAFNGEFYANKYSDVVAVFGRDGNVLKGHFNTNGVDEGRDPSIFFNAQFYLMKNPDVAQVLGTTNRVAWNHYVSNGFAEKRAASPFFDVNYYLAQNSDVNDVFGSNVEAVFSHYLDNGIDEGRKASPIFDVNVYLAENSDVAAAVNGDKKAALNHFINNGINEARKSSAEFDVRDYLELNSDVADAFGPQSYKAAYEHYLANGVNENRQTIKDDGKDRKSPTITLSESSVDMFVGATETQLIAALNKVNVKVIDDVDGEISEYTRDISKVDLNKAGTYVVTYTAKDAAGNASSANLMVNVKAAGVKSVEIINPTRIVVTYDLNASGYTYKVVAKDGTNKDVTDVVYDKDKNTATLTVVPMSGKDNVLTIYDKSGAVVTTKTFEIVDLSGLATLTASIYEKKGTASKIITADDIEDLKVEVEAGAALADTDVDVTVTIIDEAKREVSATGKLVKTATKVVVSGFTGVDKLADTAEGKYLVVNVKATDANGNVFVDDATTVNTNNTGAARWTKNTKALEIAKFLPTRSNANISIIGVAGVDSSDFNYYFSKENKSASEIKKEDKNWSKIASDIPSVDAITLYAVAERKSDSKLSNVATGTVAKATAKVLSPVVYTTITDFSNITWTDSNTEGVKNYRVELYADKATKGNNAIESANDILVKAWTVDTKSANVLTEIKEYMVKEADVDYIVAVYALPETTSFVESYPAVRSLSVTGLKIAEPIATTCANTSTKLGMLTIGGPANAKGYEIQVFNFVDATTPADVAVDTVSVDKTKDSATTVVDLAKVLANVEGGKYALKVRSIASDSNMINSEFATVANNSYVYKLAAPSDLTYSLSGKKLTVKFTEVGNLYSSDTKVEYKLAIGTVNAEGNVTWGSYNTVTATDGAFEVEATLTAGNNYKAKIAIVDTTATYGYTIVEKEIKDVIKVPTAEITLTNAVYDGEYTGANVESAGEISYKGSTLYYNNSGEVVEINSDNEYSKYSEIIKILPKLKAGDKITVTNDGEIEVRKENSANVDYEATLTNATLVIPAESREEVITGTVKAVKLSGSAVDLSGLTVTDKVEALNDGATPSKVVAVKVKAGTTVALTNCQNATTIVNDIAVTTGFTVKATENGLDITAKKAALEIIPQGIKESEVAINIIGNIGANAVRFDSAVNSKTTKVVLTADNPLQLVVNDTNTRKYPVDISGVQLSSITYTGKIAITKGNTFDGLVRTDDGVNSNVTVTANNGDVIITPTASVITAIEGDATVVFEKNAKLTTKVNTTTINDSSADKTATFVTGADESLVVTNVKGEFNYNVVLDSNNENGVITINNVSGSISFSTVANS